MKLSVITINKNNKPGLIQTMNSVFIQSYKNFEYIIIDGDSTDGSPGFIKKNEGKISYWISEPDTGIYNAMNKAIKVAKGEYCYFLNSGDVLVSEKVFEQVFSDNNIDTSFICGNLIWDKKGLKSKDNSYKNRDWSFSLYDIYAGFLSHQAFFIKRTMFSSYGFYDERLKLMSDWKLFYQAIAIHCEKVHYVDVDIAIYNTDGLSSSIGGKVILEEKRTAARELLPEQTYKDIDRLYYLYRNGFIIDFVLSKKWIHFLFKIFFKLCTVLKLTKY